MLPTRTQRPRLHPLSRQRRKRGRGGEREPGQGEEHPSYSSASLQILASMPSRTIGRSLGAIISQYCNRTAQLRRRSSRPPLQQLYRTARPSLRHYDLESDPTPCAPDKRSLLVKELLSVSPNQCSHMLLTMPLSLVGQQPLWHCQPSSTQPHL
uniref:Uncharacterized protein n=1 Tax=Malurus cyaneus samueli TaxID=2593467 RepID=A0A8C5U938_9PASS